jgi:plasmid stabilization system protein ParE
MSQRALSDLLAIHNYISNSNPVAARRLLDDLNHKIKWLAQAGATGVPRSFAPGLRAFPYRERCIYFVVSEDIMTVLRILHGHQNITPEDFPESTP